MDLHCQALSRFSTLSVQMDGDNGGADDGTAASGQKHRQVSAALSDRNSAPRPRAFRSARELFRHAGEATSWRGEHRMRKRVSMIRMIVSALAKTGRVNSCAPDPSAQALT